MSESTHTTSNVYEMPQAYVLLTRFCVVAFPTALLLFDSGGSALFLMLAFLSLFAYLSDKRDTGLNPVIRRYQIIVTCFFLLAIGSHLLTGMNNLGENKLNRLVALLMVMPFISLFIRVRLNQAWVWLGIIIGAVVAGLFSIYEWVNTPLPDGAVFRYGAALNPVRFGGISMILGALGLCSVYWLAAKHKVLSLLALTAAVLGLIAAIASGTRGAWLIAPFYIPIVFLVYRRHIPKQMQIAFVTTALVLPIVLYSVPQTQVASRIAVAQADWNDYFSEQSTINEGNVRLEMWRASIMMLQEAPLFGVGLGNFKSTAKAYGKEGLIDPQVARYRNPHSTYMTILATLGLSGFILIIITLTLPALIAWRHMRHSDSESGIYILAILLVVVGYLVSMLTNDMFDVKASTLFFVMLITQFLYLLLHPPES